MKIITILGTRPEIIRLSRVIPLLDNLCNHILVHTGQNYDPKLNDVFFNDLCLRAPNYSLQCKSDTSMGEIGKILVGCEGILVKEKPDRLLLLGDTNSSLVAFLAKRMGIPIFHMEAGNRCYDDHVPEEVNRRIIDHSSDVLMPYTQRSRSNLLREGIFDQKIFVTGNPIKEVLDYYKSEIDNSSILNKLNIKQKKYFLVTLHRAENVDISKRLQNFIAAFHLLYVKYKYPIICVVHPRTRSQLKKQSLVIDGNGIEILEPLGLFDFVHLEKNALCVLSDSGTVQEECCIFNVPSVTLRDVTERPETLEVGSNILSGSEPESILNCVNTILHYSLKWNPPIEYLVNNVSGVVAKIILGYNNKEGNKI